MAQRATDEGQSTPTGALGAAMLTRPVLGSWKESDCLHFLRLRDAYLRREIGVAFVKSLHQPSLVETAVRSCQEHE